MPESILDIARRYVEASLSVIPIGADGTKQPAFRLLPRGPDGRPTWGPFQKNIATPEELAAMFQDGVGIAIVTGWVSGNLEDIDFDDAASYTKWHELIIAQGGQELLDQLVKVQTPRPGAAIVYRCPDGIEGNQELARRRTPDGEVKALIETRGEGGYFLAPGCPPSCHPRKRGYLLKKGDILNPPVITRAERALLLDTAKSLNEYVEPQKIIASAPAIGGDGLRPGDIFNSKASWAEILTPHKWTKVFEVGEAERWRRPGAESASSAIANYGDSELLYVWSSNASPFESKHSYSKFAAYTLLNHGGDYQAAARELASRGFGTARPEREEPPPPDAPPPEPDAAPPPSTEFQPPAYWELLDAAEAETWTCTPMEPIIEGIVARGNVVFVAAESQTGKTLVGLHIAQRMVMGGTLFGKFAITPVERVLYLALEDPVRRIKDRILDDAPPNYLPGKVLIQIAPDLDLGDEVHRLWLRDRILSLKPDVLFVDTYQKATPGIASYDDVKQSIVLHRLSNLTREVDLTIWIHDHFRKTVSGKKRWQLTADDVKGTGAKLQNADCYILMDKTDNRLRIVGKSKEWDKPFGFLLDIAPRGRTQGDKFTYAGDLKDLANRAKEQGEENRRKVFEAVGADWTSPKTVRTATGLSRATAGRHLAELAEDGEIERRGEGRSIEYRKPTDSPTASPEKPPESVNRNRSLFND